MKEHRTKAHILCLFEDAFMVRAPALTEALPDVLYEDETWAFRFQVQRAARVVKGFVFCCCLSEDAQLFLDHQH